MRTLLYLAWRNLRAAPVRSVLSALAVGFGVATLVAADLMSRSITSEIARTAEAEAITSFMSEQLDVGLTAVGLVIVLGAGFLTFNAFAMAVAQRRADFGRLRAAGMTQPQVMGMVLTEAALIGAMGSAFGVVGGSLLGQGLIGLVSATSEMFNRFGDVGVSPARMAWAAAAGVLIGLLAAWVPARRAVRVTPLAALRPPTPDTLRRPPIWPAVMGLTGGVALWLYLALAPPGAWIQPPMSSILSGLFAAAWLGCLVLTLPALIAATARSVRGLLSRVVGPSGRLAADNLRRHRSHAAFTVVTLAVGVGMIVGVTGYMTFWFEEIFFRISDTALRERPAVGLFPLKADAGLNAYVGVTQFTLPEGLREEVTAAVGDRAAVLPVHFVIVPELAFMGGRYFSFVMDPVDLRDSGDMMFTFAAGNWDDALAISDRGCAMFLTPSVARRNDRWVGDSLRLTTPTGPLECTVAGVGPTFVGASILSDAAAEAFRLTEPVGLVAFGRSRQDYDDLLQKLTAIADGHEGVWPMDVNRLTAYQREGMKSVQTAMDGMLILSVLSAGLGVVNTTVVGLTERRREFGLLRAAGAMQRQVRSVVVLEGLLFGALGAVVGIAAGAGVVLVYATVSGGSSMGFPDFPVWDAALASIGPALERGLVALLLTPLLTALVAWIPAQHLLHGSVAETLAEGQRAW